MSRANPIGVSPVTTFNGIKCGDAKVGRSFRHNVSNATGDIIITFTEAVEEAKNIKYLTHDFFFPGKVVVDYLERHLSPIYAQASKERKLQSIIDNVFKSLYNAETIIHVSGRAETIENVYDGPNFHFDRSGDIFTINANSGIVEAAWAAALLAAFRNVGYDEFYGSVYDIHKRILHAAI